MRTKIVSLLAVAFSLGVVQSASAADMPVKAPMVSAPMAVAVMSWTGWYAGLNAGWVGSTGNTISNTGTDTGAGGLGTGLISGAIPTSLSLSENGFIGGGQLGHNWQVNNWVYGIEGDFDGTSAKGNSTVGPITIPGFVPQTTTYSRALNWLATVRGRVGITATPSFMLFGTGGLAVGEVKIGNSYICPACGPPASTEPSTTNTSSNTKAGWTLGAGVEWMFAPHWSLKAEYLYVDLGSHNSTIAYTYGASTSTLTSAVNERFNVARAGVNFHF